MKQKQFWVKNFEKFTIKNMCDKQTNGDLDGVKTWRGRSVSARIRTYLGHNSKGIVVVLDSFLVGTAAIGCHMVAFLVVASHLVQPLAVVAHICAATAV